MRPMMIVLAAGLAASPGLSVEIVHPTDATLRDVDFFNLREGWAVGDQGTSWSTVDGGQTWQLRTMPTHGMLTSVRMGAIEGFATSRKSLPYQRGSLGEILFTADGGATWERTSTPASMGGAGWLWFGASGFGYAVGESSEIHPSGIAVTTDHGKSWSAMEGRATSSWTASLGVNEEQVLLGDGNGRIWVLKSGAFEASEGLSNGRGAAVRDFAAGGGRVWAVGDGGFVAFSQDSGLHWEKCALPLPNEVSSVWDFRSVAVVGSHVWIVGRPGSVVLHSSDSGQRWTIEATPSAMPLYAVDFVDETHGWAVGAMGTIVSTTDGGRSWSLQQQGDSRAGILWVSSDASTASMPAIVKLGAEEGYRLVLHAVATEAAEDGLPGSGAREARFAEAVRAAGGTIAETSGRFPLPPDTTAPTSESVLAYWSGLHGDAEENLRREIVLGLRTWQPRFVVSDERPTDPHDAIPRATIDRVCRAALAAAADKSMYCEQIEVLRLKTFEQGGLLVATSTPADGDLVIRSEEVGERVPEQFGVIGMIAESRLSEDIPSRTEVIGLRSVTANGVATESVLGTAFADGGGRRRLGASDLDGAPAEARKQMVTAAELAARFPKNREQQFESMKSVLQSTNPYQAGKLFYELGQELWLAGRVDDAKAAQDFLLVNLPEHPLAVPVYRDLLYYRTSGEIARVERATNGGAADGTEFEAGLAQVMAYAGKMQAEGQPLVRSPMTRLTLASACRQLDKRDVARRYLSPLLTLPRNMGAREIAELEMWEMNRSTYPLRRFARAMPTSKPPYLDGELDDACWVESRLATLDAGSLETTGRFPTEVRLRHDDEYLYVAATCGIPDASFRTESVARTGPDADLTGHDRVIFAIDIDRDYGSFYEFGVDSRGLVADRCGGDFGWNPKWFVATGRNEDQWRVELAIPLAELTDRRDLTREAWVFNAIRIVPGHAVLGWSGPTTPDVRGADCTLLLFGGQDAVSRTPNRAN